MNRTFWSGKRVLVTGHTGFKGGWLSLWLGSRGAQIRGYALDPATQPNLFTAASVATVLEDVRGDIRDYPKLEAAMTEFGPEVVFDRKDTSKETIDAATEKIKAAVNLLKIEVDSCRKMR